MPPIHISAAFDSGAIEVVNLDNPGDLKLRLRPDNASPFAQWFHFCITGAAGQAITCRILNAGEAAYPEGWTNYRAVASTDRQHWYRVPTTYDGQVLTISLTPSAQRIYLAYFEPYSYERHLDLLGRLALSAPVSIEQLGVTPDGRDLSLLRITPSHPHPEPQHKVWLISRQHPGETMAEWFVEGFLQRLLDEHDPVARLLLQRCVFYVVPNMNPDGSARGNLRTNALGANLNREWQTPSLERSPEVWWVRQKMHETGVDLFLDIHGDESLPFNFVAGCEGNCRYTDRIARLEDAFKAAWLAASPDFQTEHGYAKNHFGEANMTLATNWVGDTFDCLAFTIEMPFKDNANLPDAQHGWSGKRSQRLGASLLQPILEVSTRLR